MAYRRFLTASVLMLAVACALSVGAGATCTFVNATQCAVCHYTLIIAGSEACCFSFSCNDGSTGSNCGACGYAGMWNTTNRMSMSAAAGRADAPSQEAIVLSQLLPRDRQIVQAVRKLAADCH